MKTTTKSAFHRGFTLIELMIVIVILGVLMGTILPRLSGAQGRARDTAAKADLGNLAQVLELYYSDFGEYPSNSTEGTAECIMEAPDDGTGLSGDALETTLLANYIKGGTFPTPPRSEDVNVAGVTCTGQYVYLATDARGQDNQGYVLFAPIETGTNANAIIAGSTPSIPSDITATPVPTAAQGGSFDISSALDWLIGDSADETGAKITFDTAAGGPVRTIFIVASGT